MLTRSPQVPARSPSASPSSFHTSRASSNFHYAPTSPQIRSSKSATAVSRRQSASSPLGVNTKASCASVQQQQQPPTPQTSTQAQRDRPSTTYVAVDAATQYSPMEPHDYYAPRFAPTRPPPLIISSSLPDATSTHRDTVPRSPHPSSQPVARHAPEASASASASSATTVSAPALPEHPPMLKAPHPLSPPNKRRNSQGPGSVVGGSSSSAAQGLSKRVKPEMAPPKVLPVRYELCTSEDIVVLIANMLSELIETNDALAMRSGHLTRFHSRTAPGISVIDYLHRLAKHATLIPPLLLSMVYYIDRLCSAYPDFTINALTVHRFLITAATVAAKGLSDSFWNNSTYARVGGIKVAELKLLELEFLHRVDWKIVPDHDVLIAYYRGLVQRSPAYVLEDEADDNNDESPMDEGANSGGSGETEGSDDLLDESDSEGTPAEQQLGDSSKPREGGTAAAPAASAA